MRRNKLAALLGATLLLGLVAVGPVAAASVVPVPVSGNPTCQDLGFDHGIKIDPPVEGTFALGSGTVTVSDIDTSVNPATFSWSSSGVTVLAVVAKGGPGANVYNYNPPASTGDSGLHAPNGFSHINFCYNEEPPSGYLKIEKEVDGGQASGDFTFHADCGNGGSFDVTITFPDPGFVTIDDIPAGSVCDVTETGMPDAPVGFHWGEPTVTENPATIKDEDTVWVHFTNHLIPDDGSLKITKDVIGGPEGYTGSFDVHVDCGNDGTFDKTIEFPDPGFVTIGDLTAGAQCTVTETGMPDAPDGFTFGAPDVSGSPATIVSDGTAAVTVTNHLTEIPPETGSLKVIKDIPGVPEGFTGSFDVRVTCTDGDPIDRTISFPDPGFITVDGLPAGALCAVIETGRSDPPDGSQWAGPLFAGTATIVADQTAEITVTNLLAEQNAVTPPPNEPTPPPTDLGVPNRTGSSDFSLMIVTLLMLGVAGGILAFAPTSIRKRKR